MEEGSDKGLEKGSEKRLGKDEVHGIHEGQESHKSKSSNLCDPCDSWLPIPILAIYRFFGSV